MILFTAMQKREEFSLGNESFEKAGESLFGDTTAYRYKFVAMNGMEYTTHGISQLICRKACHQWLRKHSVAFSGHRRVSGRGKTLSDDLQVILHTLYKAGHRFFYTGGAVGFDLLAARAVLEFRRTHPDIVLIVAVPFRNQDSKFPMQDKKVYEAILGEADFVVLLSESYYDGCYLARNDFMLENSSVLVAYWDGKTTGGTSYTCRKAMKNKTMSVVNVF